MNRKNIFLWILYDFANSIVTIVFFLYFSQWLVVDKGVSDFWYNIIFVIGSAMILLTAPILGSIADKTGRKQSYFNKITVFTFLFFLATSFTALFFSRGVFLAALFFLLANYLYQFSFVFYNAFLHYIAPKEKWGRVSGMGQAGNWLGQITGLLITLPLATGSIYLIGTAGRAQTFLPAVVLFFILALPMLLFFKLPKQESSHPQINLKEEYRNQLGQFRELTRDPNMRLFLLGYFFFNDAIITASTNFPIYLQNVFHVADSVKSSILMGILATSVIGALCSGWISDRVGLKKTLTIVIGGWVILFPVLGLVKNFSIFVLCTIFMGFLFGSMGTVTRAVMTALTPKDKLNFGFSFYTLAERVSTFLGPLTWGLIIYLFVNLGPTRYRLAAISMTVFIVIGLYFIRRVDVGEIK